MSKVVELGNIEVICTETDVHVRRKDKCEIISFGNTLISSIIRKFLSTFFVPVLRSKPRVIKKLLSLEEVNGRLIFTVFSLISAPGAFEIEK